MKAKINNFALKGIFASHCIRDLQTSGTLRTPAHSEQERKDHDLYIAASAQIREGSLQMQRYYRMLYIFENLVREFIDTTFRDEDKVDNWFETRANRDMKRKLEDRQKSEERNQWHKGRNDNPLFYMDFGDLALLIINHWPLFKDYFPDQAWVSSRIKDTERTRNVIAHTNQLSSEEGVRLEMHLRDWLNQIG